nr:hypothetical protein [Tanacetum cinerariifolium]
MTRSYAKELFTPFDDPKREFCSTRYPFKTLSLDDLSSSEFDLFSDLEEQSEGEAVETMEPTMEDYMSILLYEMDDPNITMEEYIKLEEEKAQRRGKVYSWETPTYCKIWCDEDVHDLRSIETEFPTVFYNDALTSEVVLLCEPTKNDNDKVNMPSFPSSESTISYFDDFDYFKDFEKEFPAVAYNDALASKLDFSPETTINPQHVDEFNLKNETSLFECDGINKAYPGDLTEKKMTLVEYLLSGIFYML